VRKRISDYEKHEVHREELYNLHDSSTIVKLRERTEWNMHYTKAKQDTCQHF